MHRGRVRRTLGPARARTATRPQRPCAAKPDMPHGTTDEIAALQRENEELRKRVLALRQRKAMDKARAAAARQHASRSSAPNAHHEQRQHQQQQQDQQRREDHAAQQASTSAPSTPAERPLEEHFAAAVRAKLAQNNGASQNGSVPSPQGGQHGREHTQAAMQPPPPSPPAAPTPPPSPDIPHRKHSPPLPQHKTAIEVPAADAVPSGHTFMPAIRTRSHEIANTAVNAAAAASEAASEGRSKPHASSTENSAQTRRRSLSMAEIQHEMNNKILKAPSQSLQALRAKVEALEAEAAAQSPDGGAPPAAAAPAADAHTHSLVFVSAEVAPYSKTGGLGDVVGSLPVALADRGHRVMVVSPRYLTCARDRRVFERLHDCATWVKIEHSRGEHWVNYHHEQREGVDWVFVEHMAYQRPGGLYGDHTGIYGDNAFRFSLLCLAACEAALQLQLPKHSNDLQSWDVPDVGTLAATAAPAAAMQALSNGGAHDGDGATEGAAPAAAQREPAPYPDIFGEERCSTLGQDVVFIANDWHAGMTPIYLRHKYQANGVFTRARSVLAIHNLAHQGTGLANTFPDFRLPQHVYSEMEWIYTEKDGRTTPVVNIMKGAIVCADRVTTVSESYAWEITQEEHGVGLQSILQESCARLTGIVNGMDRQTWNPQTDTLIPDRFSADNLSGKAACKARLRRQLGLPEPEYGVDVPLVGFVGRLDPQKGPDLIIDALSGLMALDCQPRRHVQIVMLGSGHPNLEDALNRANEEHPDFFRGVVKFSEGLAHRIIAGSDILLMPSRFEPCGLNQMYALRYGTVPVACATGGLRDTIDDVSPFSQGDEALGTGWTFPSATPAALVAAVGRAVDVYRDEPKRWRNIQLRGMAQDFGWSRAARAYEQVVRLALSGVEAADEAEARVPA